MAKESVGSRGAFSLSLETSCSSGSCRDKKNCKVAFSQQELRKRLTPLQYHVTQEKGTERTYYFLNLLSVESLTKGARIPGASGGQILSAEDACPPCCVHS
ncbi:hypothetical protein U0070_022045 [Myodes glareolus]|uniref:Uncharacterized protein n=1 Tax=Myodes glareolus TaxID=447135 RepID=A0AAW0I805_MYOGA